MFGNFFQRIKNLVTGGGWQTDDEEERRKEQQRQQQQQQQQQRQNTQRSSVPQPGIVIQPQQNNITNLLSSSIQPRSGGLFEVLGKVQPEQKPAKQELDVRKELERRTQENMDRAMREVTQGQNWLQRNLLNRGANERNAEIRARSLARAQFHEEHGYGQEEARDFGAETLRKANENTNTGASNWVAPILSAGRVGTGIVEGAAGLYDLITPGHGQNRLTKAANRKAKEIDALAKDMGIDTAYKIANVPLEIGSYFIPSVGLSKIGKVGGFFSRLGDSIANKVGTSSFGRRLLGRSAQEFFDPVNISKDVQLNGRYTGQDSARGEDITPQMILENLGMSILGAGVPGAVRALRKTDAHGEPTNISVSRRPTEAPAPGELDFGISSTNPAYEGIEILQAAPDLNTPAYQRGIPETVGEAQFQAERGIYNIPDTLFDADARMLERPPEIPDPLDIPAYMRRNPEVLDAAKARLAQANNLVELLQKAPSDQEIRFNQLQRMADLPTQRQRAAQSRIFQLQKANRDEAALARALGELRAAQREVNEIEKAIRAGEDPALTSPAQEIPQPAPTAVDTTPAPVAARTATDIDTSAPVEPPVQGVEVTPAVAPQEAPEIPASPTTPETPSARPQTQSRAQSSATAGEEVTAPRTRQQLASRVSDERIRAEFMENATAKERQSLAEAQNIGDERVRNLSDDELVSRYSGGKNMERPEDFFEALAAVRRLERIGTDDAVRAAADLMESVANKSSESGRWNRATQILFEDAPPTLQAEMLLRKLTRAGVEFADAAQEAEVRRQLFDKLAEADLLYRGDIDETGAVRARGVLQVRDEAIALADDVRAGAVSPEAARIRAQELAQEYGELLRQWELKNGEVMDLFERYLPKDKLGSRIGLAARLAMLSSPAGRAFDVIATVFTMLADTGDRALSALAAKAVGSQRAKTSLPSLRRVFGEMGSGLKRAKDTWQGTRRVSDVWNELDMKTRSDIRKASGAFSRRVKAMTEAPTLMSEGIRKDELRRIGMQRAKEAGLEGGAAKVYADLYSIGASKADQYAARQEWLKANLLHDNKLSDFFTKIGRSLEQSGLAGNWVKNMTIPFTSFASGNIQRALTDRNVLHNTWKIFDGARKQDPQMIVDALGKLTTNVAGTVAASMILAENGILTDKDANGDNYDGVYLKIGDLYIPVALTGQFAPILIGGYALNKALAADNPAEGIATFIGNNAVGIAKSVDMTSMFGGDNALMNRVTDLGRIAVGDDSISQKVFDILIRLGGDTVRQYIPSLTGDVNAVLDQTPLNPTGEAAETKITKENPDTGRQVTDVLASELAKTASRIPVLSQQLERQEGVLAKSPVDRLLKSTRKSDSQKQAEAEEQAAEERSAELAKRGIPDHRKMKTIEEFNAAVENLAYDGEFSKAIEALKNRLADMEKDPKASRSSKEKIRKQITEYEVLSKGNFSMDDLEAYQAIGVEDWRKLGDPESEYYNKNAYERLWALDVALAERKVGGGRGLNKDGQKYSVKKSSSDSGGGRSGGRGGSRGGSRSNTIGSPTALAKIDFGKLKPQQTGTPRVPTITRLKPSELKKKRKITVSRP